MRYYMIERDAEEEDDPCRLYLELADDGILQRKIEVYLNGVYCATGRESAPADLAALTGDGQRLLLSPQQFEEMWYQTRELPDGFTGLFF
ncbi:hypothetical protein [Oscillibacter sp.]|uniref:hypothetical protein n=1 Tax=Oscillibacter sp. TaxID=1945593 RepID=UPI00262857D2|nr:hypothetical protein [Oscillibacter sp.]MDD3346068.1 hypothetical protein [Oscillibacter sp.]